MNNLNELSQQWILYYVAQEKINQFKIDARQSQDLINELFSEKYVEVNMNIPICNIWLALHEHLPNEEPLFLNESFGMAYGAGFFKIKYIENSRAISRYLETKKLDAVELVILATNLVHQLMNWLELIVDDANQNEIFALYNEEDCLCERLPSDYKFNKSQKNQKIFQQIILKNVNDSNDLDKFIQYALQKTNIDINNLKLQPKF